MYNFTIIFCQGVILMKPEIKKTIVALSIIAVITVAFALFIIKSTNTSKEKALETAKKDFYSISSSSVSNNETKLTNEKITEYTQQETNGKSESFDLEKVKSQSDDVFVDSIVNEYYIIKSSAGISFVSFIDTDNIETDDVIEKIVLGITSCWSKYCSDYQLLTFMYCDLNGNNICLYSLTNMSSSKFSNLGNDIIWSDNFKEYKEAYQKSRYKETLDIFNPEQ